MQMNDDQGNHLLFGVIPGIGSEIDDDEDKLCQTRIRFKSSVDMHLLSHTLPNTSCPLSKGSIFSDPSLIFAVDIAGGVQVCCAINPEHKN